MWNESKQRWISTAAGELVPGDMFRLTMSQEERKNSDTASDKTEKQQELIVPVDALVIKGQCLTNEAILTGESVPQIKKTQSPTQMFFSKRMLIFIKKTD